MSPKFTKPRKLLRQTELTGFTCGVESIDEWVRRFALQNQVRRMSSVYISHDQEGRLAGIYTLSAFTVARKETGELFKGGPVSIPVVLIGKLAVATSHQGTGLGYSLLQDAIHRSVQASEVVAAAAILVHTVEDNVGSFYEKFGFRAITHSKRTLILPLKGLETQLS